MFDSSRIEHPVGQLASASDEWLLAEVVELDAELARSQFRPLSVLAGLKSRNVPGRLGFRGLSDLISAQLRCERAGARRRSLATTHHPELLLT